MEEQPKNDELANSEEQPDMIDEPTQGDQNGGEDQVIIPDEADASKQPQLSAPTDAPRGPEPLAPSSARTWAMLSHLSILLNLFTGILGPITALIIYLVFKDRSRYVAYQSMQSFVFQLVFFVVAGALTAVVWLITIPLMFLLVGFCLVPLAILFSLIPIAALIYGVVGAIQTAQGDDFRYWLVGDWVLPSEGSPGPI